MDWHSIGVGWGKNTPRRFMQRKPEIGVGLIGLSWYNADFTESWNKILEPKYVVEKTLSRSSHERITQKSLTLPLHQSFHHNPFQQC